MGNSKYLGLMLLAPAGIFVFLFFLAPVVLTGVFGFTNMSTATGISGGAYMITEDTMRSLKARYGEEELAQKLLQNLYVVDEAGLERARAAGADSAAIEELRAKYLGQSFDSRRALEKAIKNLDNRPASIRAIKKIAAEFERSVVNTRFDSAADLLAAIEEFGIALNPDQKAALAEVSYTGWVFTTQNFKTMVELPDTWRTMANTLFYVFTTLILFNTGFALVLSIATHYMAEAPAGFFRAMWLLPRITPPVLYVLMWKWLAWDNGFLDKLLVPLGFHARNWLLDTPTNAWVFVILINGIVGASMGMLIFSSAIKAIPKPLFYASEVDGAGRWQQIRHIILPQLRWPILFITSYQTLSLLTSFEYILLSTDGGPGGATEVWALSTYMKALNNYGGALQYGYGAALSLVLVVIGVTLSLLYLRLFNFNTLTQSPKIEQ